MWLLDKKWYSTLIDGLLPNINGNPMLISYTPNIKTHLYSHFVNYVQFGQWYYHIDNKQRHFYEIIEKNKPQKPYFDLDIDDVDIDHHKILELVVETILNVFGKYNIVLKLDDILVFSSHGENKYSYHIIINNYCFMDLSETKIWMKQIYNQIPNSIKKYVDQKVYTQHRQFRIVNSSKVNSNRIKQFQKSWIYKGKEINYKLLEDEYQRFMDILGKSLITYTNECLIIPRTYTRTMSSLSSSNNEVSNNEVSNNKLEEFTITSEWINKALQLSCPDILITSTQFPYQVNNILTNGIITLKRLSKTYCKVCNRDHENENPYLLIKKGKKIVHAYFSCRRNYKYILLGILEIYESPVIKIKNNHLDNINKYHFDSVTV